MENRYDKYKDSGIAWIGEIPEHWEVCSIKQIMKNKSIKGFPNETVLSLYRDFGIIPKDSRDDNHNVTSEDTSNYKLVENGDFVINKMKAWQGSMAISDFKGIISPAYYICKIFSPKVVRKYIHYLLRDESYKAEYMRLSTGMRIGQWDLNIDDFLQINTILPLLSEQQSIATYLDQKCGEIDELITMQEEMITKLQSYKQSVITEAVTKGLDKNVPLKDSGIEWIGKIPEHWKVKRLKFSCNVFGRIGFRGYKSDDLVSEGNGAITLSPSNMKDMKMDYTNRTYLSWKKYYESPEIMISKNDILMVKTGSTYGKCSFVDDIPMECTINPQIVVFKQHKDYPKFLAYSFQTKATRAFVETSVVGGTIPTIAQEKIMNYFFAFPPLSEQQSIANYLD